jgi:hypothetical protein
MKHVVEAFYIGFGFCWGAIIAGAFAIGAAHGVDTLIERWLP